MVSFPLSVRYMVLSAISFAFLGACVKTCSFRGIPVLEILAARALISSVLSYLDIRRKNISPWGNNKLLLTARGALGTLALICVFYSVTTLPLAEATLIQYLYPLFTALLGVLFLQEKIQRATLICILLSLLGLFIMVQPSLLMGMVTKSSEPLPTLGVIAALFGAMGSGAAYVLVRKLSTTEDTSVIIFYFPFIALPLSIALLGNNFVMPTGSTWLLLLLVGIFTQVGQFGLTKAMQLEYAGKAAAYAYVQVIFSAVLGWWLFSEIPTLATFLGAICIIGGAMVNIYYQPAEKKKPAK